MVARFILSLDCEGKWGVADCLNTSHRRDLADEPLKRAYNDILRLLDQHGIPATFAFAGLFSQSADQFAKLHSQVETLADDAADYLQPALRDIDATQGSGWHGAHLLDSVATANAGHEIALHGVTHVPWTGMSNARAEAEMRLFQQLEGPIRNSRTFVYPRNLVAHPELLGRSGLVGYRAAPANRSRAASLASEFNVFARPQLAAQTDGLIQIPGGYFFNWRSGPRRLVPPAVTRLRGQRLLERAARSGGVVHYWLHPENIATGPSTLKLLRDLIEDVARQRDAGKCVVMTQLDYCHWVRTLA